MALLICLIPQRDQREGCCAFLPDGTPESRGASSGDRAIGECWLQEMNIERILSSYPDRDCRRIDLTIGEKDFWGHGYGTDAIRALTRFGFEDECADIIFGAEVGDYNPRCRRAFEKAGYVVQA
jgi:RimJ/RimL family protein N-acetyltransferase